MAKVTKREMFEAILAVLDEGTAEAAFVEKELELLAKRAGAERKPNANQVANEALKAEMVAMLAVEGNTATEVANAFDVTVQKAAQLLKQLVTAGAVVRVEGKGKEKTRFVRAE